MGNLRNTTAMNDSWADLAAAHWGEGLVLTPLPGEYDLNFRVHGRLQGVLKVMHAGCARGDVEVQIALLESLKGHAELPVPRVIPSKHGASLVELRPTDDEPRLAWLISHLPGSLLGNAPQRSAPLLADVGRTVARLHLAIQPFRHPSLERSFKWDLREAAWVRPHLHLVQDPARRTWVAKVLDDFEATHLPLLRTLPVQAIHNDLNDYNILVSDGPGDDGQQPARVCGLIDFGDILYGPAVADLAIAAAYVVMDTLDPVASLASFVAGYCAVRPLPAREAEAIWPLLLTRLCVSVVNCAIRQRERPEDAYVRISERPAWAVLDRSRRLDPRYVTARIRGAAGLEPVPARARLRAALGSLRGSCAPALAGGLAAAARLDMSPTGDQSPDDPFAPDPAELARRIGAVQGAGATGIGCYGEATLLHAARNDAGLSHPASDRCTVRMGVQLFAQAGTTVMAPLAGQVASVAWGHDGCSASGQIVVEHPLPDTEGGVFFTRYAGLSKVGLDLMKIGAPVACGQVLGRLAGEVETDGFPPSLRLQVAAAPGANGAWPWVVDPDEADTWRHLYPSPAALLNVDDAVVEAPEIDTGQMWHERQRHLPSSLKLSYARPLQIVRGWRQMLFDEKGRAYLDAYNNVPHVGHSHPAVVAAVARQARLLSTNTRYLHRGLGEYAKALVDRLPPPLEVCFFVNSGSEANDLAIRLARAYTGRRDVMVSEHGYHGITDLDFDISHYKFARAGGHGQQSWVHITGVPDTYRGRHRGDDAGAAYAADVERQLDRLAGDGRSIAAFISEPFPSVGGQIVPPMGYLARVYPAVRRHGGVAIADEVQTGLGRLGRFQWGFEHQGAVPDIVVLGKPLGNGYPIGAVVTTRAIADALAPGAEFFSTFGGSTLACAAGMAVLRVLDEERLAENAEQTGAHLLSGLRDLARESPIVGDVRGVGLFVGVELTAADGSAASEAARLVVNRLRDRRILIGSDGPQANVLKIRPPLCFNRNDADHLLGGLRDALRRL